MPPFQSTSGVWRSPTTKTYLDQLGLVVRWLGVWEDFGGWNWWFTPNRSLKIASTVGTTTNSTAARVNADNLKFARALGL